MTVVSLKDANEQADPDIVEMLRDVLEMAERGEIRSITIAAGLTGHRTYTDFSTRDLTEAIGLVGFLHHTLCAKQRDTPA